MKKKIVLPLLLLALCASLSAQTVDLGKHMFFNGEAPINLAVDARMVPSALNAPYVMFMVYMTADKGYKATVDRKGITLIYKGQEYPMPSVKELRKGYDDINRDMRTYARLGLENLSVSEMSLYEFDPEGDLFPAPESGMMPSDTVSMSRMRGARTNVYFKNLGFKIGDELIIRVKDKKKPELTTEVKVVL